MGVSTIKSITLVWFFTIRQVGYPMCLSLAAFCLFLLTSRLWAPPSFMMVLIYLSVSNLPILGLLFASSLCAHVVLPAPLCWACYSCRHLRFQQNLLARWDLRITTHLLWIFYVYTYVSVFSMRICTLHIRDSAIFMEVTMKEDLGWEANLAAHVSIVLWILITFSTLSYINLFITWGKVLGIKALRRIPSVDG